MNVIIVLPSTEEALAQASSRDSIRVQDQHGNQYHLRRAVTIPAPEPTPLQRMVELLKEGVFRIRTGDIRNIQEAAESYVWKDVPKAIETRWIGIDPATPGGEYTARVISGADGKLEVEILQPRTSPSLEEQYRASLEENCGEGRR